MKVINDWVVSGIRKLSNLGFLSGASKFEVRDYQTAALQKLDEWMTHRVNGIMCGPPNCGKGYIMDEWVSRLVREGKKVLIVSHKRDLALERLQKLLAHMSYETVKRNPFKYGIGGAILGLGMVVSCSWTERVRWTSPASLIASMLNKVYKKGETLLEGFRLAESDVGLVIGGEPRNLAAPVQIATIQSLESVLHAINVDVIIIDETHHFEAEEWRKVLESVPGAPLKIGFTATPQRADGVPLSQTFADLYEIINYSGMRERGMSVPLVVYLPSKRWFAKRKHHDAAQDIFTAYERHSKDKPGLVYVSNIQFAEETARTFRANGYRAKAIHSKSADRDGIEQFNNGELDILVNVHILAEGLNLPRAEVCILARAMQHKSTFRQTTGRVLRQNEQGTKKESIVIDLVGNTWVHGLPDADVVYSLDSDGLKDFKKIVGGARPRNRLEADDQKPYNFHDEELLPYSEAVKEDVVVVMDDFRSARKERKKASSEPKPWTPAEVEHLELLKAQGKNLNEIAEILGRSYYSIVCQSRKVYRQRNNVAWTKEQDSQILELKKAGYSEKEIAEKTGRTENAIHNRIRRLEGRLKKQSKAV